MLAATSCHETESYIFGTTRLKSEFYFQNIYRTHVRTISRSRLFTIRLRKDSCDVSRPLSNTSKTVTFSSRREQASR